MERKKKKSKNGDERFGRMRTEAQPKEEKERIILVFYKL